MVRVRDALTYLFYLLLLLRFSEPTNHLDKDSLESLAAAVEKFQGAVIVVSHNRDFMSRCANEMWTVANGRVKVEVADGELVTFDDLFEGYKATLQKETRR
jgi:ATP-binding cassette subfamily F protein 3